MTLKLSEQLQDFRTDRPSEWQMDEFKERAENLEDLQNMYWYLLRVVEENCRITGDVIDKHNVNNAYKIWNRIEKTDLKPVWEDS